MTTQKGIEQERAEYAYNCVEEVLLLRMHNGNISIPEKGAFEEIFFRILKPLINEKEELKALCDAEMIRGYINKAIDKTGTEKENRQELLKKIEKVAKEGAIALSRKYKTHVKKMPAYIKTNGLGATLGFVLSKARNDANAWNLIYWQLRQWLQNRPHLAQYEYPAKDGSSKVKKLEEEPELVKFVIHAPSSHYRALTLESLAFFGWLRRFVEGRIEGEEED